MVRKLPLLLAALALVSGTTYVVARPAYHFGPDPSYTGAPETGAIIAEHACNTCHYVVDQNNLNAGNGYIHLLDVPSTYVAGQTYTLRVEVDCDSTRDFATRHWGFQVTSFRASDGQGVGTFVVPSGAPLMIVTGFSTDPWSSRNYIEHAEAGIQEGVSGPVQWTFQWQAPSTPSGTIVFAAAGNAANGNYDSDGDWIYTTTDSTVDLTTPTRPITWGGIKAQYRR